MNTPESQQVQWSIPGPIYTLLTAYAEHSRCSHEAAAIDLITASIIGLLAEPVVETTSWSREDDFRWNVFRAVLRDGGTAEEAAEIAGLTDINPAA